MSSEKDSSSMEVAAFFDDEFFSISERDRKEDFLKFVFLEGVS